MQVQAMSIRRKSDEVFRLPSTCFAREWSIVNSGRWLQAGTGRRGRPRSPSRWVKVAGIFIACVRCMPKRVARRRRPVLNCQAWSLSAPHEPASEEVAMERQR
ncbi:hypothetical protein MJ575_00945 [Klebsiella pneumoniae]|nr:hypothetical protein MJ575_00945 [Klebsiella pneumoniae]